MKKNKGFTLVEIIVILVILAILAAILIPSLTTYIDKAKEKQITGNARAAYVAAQAMASEMYGLDCKIEAVTAKTGVYAATLPALPDGNATGATADSTAQDEATYIVCLAQLNVKDPTITLSLLTKTSGSSTITDGTIDPATFVYSETVGNVVYTATHQASGNWVVTKADAAASTPAP